MRSHTVLLPLLVVSASLATEPLWAARYQDAVRKGNEAFDKKEFKTALEQYRIADADQPETPEVNYNLGGALYADEKYEEAAQAYERALRSDDPALRGKALYNLGNTKYRLEDYPAAISAYEEALKINPKDLDAKFNLELARRMLKENTKPQQQDQQQQQQQDQQQDQQQQNQQDEQNQQQQNQQQQQDQQSQQGKDKDQKLREQQQQANKQKMSKEDAERILNALRDNENDTQKKVRRSTATGDYKGKDW